MKMKDPRRHDERHLSYLRGLSCLVCLDNTSVEAAHVRFSDGRAAKKNPGVGQKPHDHWAVPLCSKHHKEQHAMNEQDFWFNVYGIDPLAVAAWLYLASGDHDAGMQIIQAQH